MVFYSETYLEVEVVQLVFEQLLSGLVETPTGEVSLLRQSIDRGFIQ